jgi:hypothetical protein
MQPVLRDLAAKNRDGTLVLNPYVDVTLPVVARDYR